MKYIISGTNRIGSNTLKIAQFVKNLYAQVGEQVEIIDLAALPLSEFNSHHYGSKEALPSALQSAIDKVNTAEGLIMIVPEYNGSMPGALKYFIDFWKYPDSFEFRPVCFVGLGGLFGGLRPVEHLQQVFGYRNAYIFPQRLFLQNVWNLLKEGELKDPTILKLLQDQVVGFKKFVLALESQGLDANTANSKRAPKV